MIASVAIHDLVELAWVALVATVLLSTSAAVCLLGWTRASELRRAGSGGPATGYAALGLLGGAAVVGSAVAAVAIIVSG